VEGFGSAEISRNFPQALFIFGNAGSFDLAKKSRSRCAAEMRDAARATLFAMCV
jgi:hypothetical protein